MYGVAELLSRRLVGVIRSEIRVVWCLAIRTPVTLVLQGVRVPNRYTLVAITIGGEKFVRLRIKPDLGDATNVVCVVTAFAAVGVSNFSQELAVLAELQDEAVMVNTRPPRHTLFRSVDAC